MSEEIREPMMRKMGKTEHGAIWIDRDKISAYEFYQGVYQTPDACVRMMFALFTDLPMDEVDNLINTDIVNAKRILSYEMTKFIRGEEDAILAQKTAEEVFRGAGKSENMPTVEVDKAEFGSGLAICEMLEKIKICASRGEARRLIEQGGISLDGEKVTDAKMIVAPKDEMVVKKGKKIFVKVVVK